MTHLTRSRTKEVSIRLALGASSREILGVAAAAVLGRSASAMLYGVSPIDPVTLAAGVTLLLAVATVAAYVPAHRAATVEAVRALRD